MATPLNMEVRATGAADAYSKYQRLTSVLGRFGKGANQVTMQLRAQKGEYFAVANQIEHLNAQMRNHQLKSISVLKSGQGLNAVYGKQAGVFSRLKGSISGAAGQLVGMYLGVTMLLKIGNELFQWVKHGIDEFRKFEKEIAEVATILGDELSESTLSAKIGIESLSLSYGKNVHDLTKGLYDIVSAAVPVEDAMNLLTIATKAAIAGLSDVATSVDVLTSILNAYGLQVEQMTSISDKLFMTVKRGKLVYEDLASAMGYVAPIAANLGVEFDEIAAAMATATRQGQHIDMVSRGLALAMQNIADLSPQAAEAAQKYGVDLSAVALQVGGLDEIIRDLNEAMDKNGNYILPQMIRNMRSLRVMYALTGKEGIKGLSEDLNYMSESAGRTEEALSYMMNTTMTQADKLEQRMEQLGREVGEAWSGPAIWLEKVKLWWGKIISFQGLESANKALSDFNDETYKLSIQDMDSVIKSFDIIEEKAGNLSAIDILTGTGNEASKDMIYEGLNKYLSAKEAKPELELIYNSLKKLKGFGEDVQGLYGTYLNPDEAEAFKKYNSEIFEGLSKIKSFDASTFPDISKAYRLDEGLMIGAYIEKLEPLLSHAKDEFEANEKTITNNIDLFNQLVGGLQDYESEMDESISNIDTLRNAIRELNVELRDVYKTAGGETFAGTLAWEREVKATSASLNAFKRDTTYAIEYGGKYEGVMADTVRILSNYERKQKQVNDTVDQYGRLIDINTLKLMKLDLKEMMSRHGLRRGDGILREQLQIKNQKLRIKQKSDELKLTEGLGSAEEEKYITAKNAYEKYIADEEYRLSLLKDTTKSELEDFDDAIAYKEEKLGKYNNWELDQIENLSTSYMNFYRLLQLLQEEASTSGLEESEKMFSGMLKQLEEFKQENLSYFGGTSTNTGMGTKKWGDYSGESWFNPETGRTEPAYTKAGRDPWNAGFYKLFQGFQRGTFSVPKDGIYHLHGGEEIVPRGSHRHGGAMRIQVAPITVNARITQDADIRALGSKIGEAIASGFVSGVSSEFQVG